MPFLSFCKMKNRFLKNNFFSWNRFDYNSRPAAKFAAGRFSLA